MLLALTRPSRSADLTSLNLKGFRTTPEGAVFVPVALAKQSTANKPIKDFFFPRFTENVRLCPVQSLTLYIERTKQLRGESSQLFIAIIKPHLPVTSSTVARWLKQVIGDSGIDTSIFKAHSVRGASTSAAANQWVTTEDILKAADWSNSSTFQRFYYKPVRNATFGRTVLSVSYEQHNWYVRLSLLKYNIRMAKTTKWLNAILHYMKKVKSSISMSLPPTPVIWCDMLLLHSIMYIRFSKGRGVPRVANFYSNVKPHLWVGPITVNTTN